MIHTIYAFCDIYSQVLIPVHTVYNCYEKKTLFPYDPISHCKFDTEITIDVDFIQLQKLCAKSSLDEQCTLKLCTKSNQGLKYSDSIN